jgi:hypothetical protein
MNRSRCLLVAALLGVASGQALACYTVYGPADRVLYRSAQAPVDMSRPIHETLSQRFPGGHLVFDAASSCEELPASARPLPVERNSRMYTDKATAQAMKVPYTVVTGNVVMIESGGPTVRPAVNTISAVVGSRPRTQQATVITELRNPPVTIVESSEGTTISGLSR